MEKYFHFLTDGEDICLPVTPQVARWTRGVSIETVNISAVGEVYLPGKAARYRGRIEGIFPARPYS